jgi:hypothetical protein
MKKAVFRQFIQFIPLLTLVFLSICLIALCYQIRLTRIIPQHDSTPQLLQSIKMQNERGVPDAHQETIDVDLIKAQPEFHIPDVKKSRRERSDFIASMLLRQFPADSSYMRPPPCVQSRASFQLS